MLDEEQEYICKIIDQRESDKALVAAMEREHDPPQLFWTGRIRIIGMNCDNH